LRQGEGSDIVKRMDACALLLRTIAASIAAATASALFLLGSGCPAGRPCATSDDCRAGEVCLQGDGGGSCELAPPGADGGSPPSDAGVPDGGEDGGTPDRALSLRGGIDVGSQTLRAGAKTLRGHVHGLGPAPRLERGSVTLDSFAD
jgi:hypothetical protein